MDHIKNTLCAVKVTQIRRRRGLNNNIANGHKIWHSYVFRYVSGSCVSVESDPNETICIYIYIQHLKLRVNIKVSSLRQYGMTEEKSHDIEVVVVLRTSTRG